MQAFVIGLGIVAVLFIAAAIVRITGRNRFNFNHPEMQKDEVFITNSDKYDCRHIGWKTKRYGKKAYDIYGKCISESGWKGSFPVFVKKSEMIAAGFRIFQIRLLRIQIFDHRHVDLTKI